MMRAPTLLLARFAVGASATLPAFPAAADDLQTRVQAVRDGLRAAQGFPGATVAHVLPDGCRGTAHADAGGPHRQASCRRDGAGAGE